MLRPPRTVSVLQARLPCRSISQYCRRLSLLPYHSTVRPPRSAQVLPVHRPCSYTPQHCRRRRRQAPSPSHSTAWTHHTDQVLQAIIPYHNTSCDPVPRHHHDRRLVQSTSLLPYHSTVRPSHASVVLPAHLPCRCAPQHSLHPSLLPSHSRLWPPQSVPFLQVYVPCQYVQWHHYGCRCSSSVHPLSIY